MPGKCPVHQNPMPFDEEFSRDPFGYFAELHAAGPIHRVCIPSGDPAWLVTRYEDVYRYLRDQRLARPRKYAGPDYTNTRMMEGAEYLPLVMEDPPEQTRGRKLVNYAFIPKRLDALMPMMNEMVDEMLDRIADDGKADLMEALVGPFPVNVVAEILGVAPGDRDRFRAWGDALFGTGPREEGEAAFGELMAFIDKLIATKLENPTDDLISYMATATHSDGEPVTPKQVRQLATIIIISGFDTTVGSIANALIALLSEPAKFAQLRDNPDLITNAIEELLRLHSSVTRGFRRFATEDMVIGGQHIAKGDTVLLALKAADRDPCRFANPDEMDFDRPDIQHVGFGRGPHVCPASQLARIEFRLVLEKLIERFPNLELAVAPEHVEWRLSDLVRTPVSIPVKF